MDLDAALAILKDDDIHYKSPQRNAVLRGLLLIAEASGGIDSKSPLSIAAEHDEIFVGDFTQTVAVMTEEQVRQMSAWGWSESYDSWHHFV